MAWRTVRQRSIFDLFDLAMLQAYSDEHPIVEDAAVIENWEEPDVPRTVNPFDTLEKDIVSSRRQSDTQVQYVYFIPVVAQPFNNAPMAMVNNNAVMPADEDMLDLSKPYSRRSDKAVKSSNIRSFEEFAALKPITVKKQPTRTNNGVSTLEELIAEYADGKPIARKSSKSEIPSVAKHGEVVEVKVSAPIIDIAEPMLFEEPEVVANPVAFEEQDETKEPNLFESLLFKQPKTKAQEIAMQFDDIQFKQDEKLRNMHQSKFADDNFLVTGLRPMKPVRTSGNDE